LSFQLVCITLIDVAIQNQVASGSVGQWRLTFSFFAVALRCSAGLAMFAALTGNEHSKNPKINSTTLNQLFGSNRMWGP